MKRNNGQGDAPVPALTRRGFLTLSSTALLLAGATVTAAAGNCSPRGLWIYDPALGAAANRSHFATTISVDEEKQTGWRQLRSLQNLDTAAGVTSWSDLLIIRGQLEHAGMRLLEAVERGPGFHWVMRRRSPMPGIR